VNCWIGDLSCQQEMAESEDWEEESEEGKRRRRSDYYVIWGETSGGDN
jgi:hypothetical protein